MAALCLKAGVLYVGRGAMTARVGAYDLDGHVLDPEFSFRGRDGARAAVSGMAVDDDHRIWIADSASRSLRCFTLFGAEIASVAREDTDPRDVPGALGTPVDVVSQGHDDAQRLLVASKGTRRHALQELAIGLVDAPTRSLRPMGEPNGRFRGIQRLSREGRFVYVCEPNAGRVQVFRDDEFHFALATRLGDDRFTPRAAAALPDGRIVVAHSRKRSALVVFDAGGRLERELVGHGEDEGCVHEPVDLALEAGDGDARTRLAVLDREGDRVQVFNLEGRCYGAFPVLPGSGKRAAR